MNNKPFKPSKTRRDTAIMIVPTEQEAMSIALDECDTVNDAIYAEYTIDYTSPLTGKRYLTPIFIIEHYK